MTINIESLRRELEKEKNEGRGLYRVVVEQYKELLDLHKKGEKEARQKVLCEQLNYCGMVVSLDPFSVSFRCQFNVEGFIEAYAHDEF